MLCWWGYGTSSLVSLPKRPRFSPVLTRRTHHIVDLPTHTSTCLAQHPRHHACHLLMSFASSNTCMHQCASNVLFHQTRLVAVGLLHVRLSCTERSQIWPYLLNLREYRSKQECRPKDPRLEHAVAQCFKVEHDWGGRSFPCQHESRGGFVRKQENRDEKHSLLRCRSAFYRSMEVFRFQ